MVVLQRLREAGAEVKMFSGGKASEFMRGQGVDADGIVEDPVPTIINGEMKLSALWYARSWVALRRTAGRTRRLFDDFRPDLVVGDEEFSGLILAGERGVTRVMVSDELKLGFGRTWLSKKIERRVDGWYRRLQDSVDLLVIPEEGQDSGNRRYVGPIVRPLTLAGPEVRARYGLPGGRMVLLSLSGSGIGRHLLRETIGAVLGLDKDVVLVVTGNRGERVRRERVYDLGFVQDNQNLVAAADLVISTAGKSTIDEAAAAGTPIIAIPIKDHAEQERNAADLGYSYADLERLPELVKDKVGKRQPPMKLDGASAAADLILSRSQVLP